MSTTNVKRYSTGIKIIHWLIALTVIIMLVVGFLLDSIPEQYKSTAYMMHKSTGITILFLMILRFVWINIVGRPPLPPTVKKWERILSRFIQYSFYVLLIIMPLTGWIMSVAADRIPVYFNLFKAPLPWITPDKSLAKFMVESHETIAWILIVFISLHVLGALKHHFIDKDRVLKSMLPEK